MTQLIYRRRHYTYKRGHKANLKNMFVDVNVVFDSEDCV